MAIVLPDVPNVVRLDFGYNVSGQTAGSRTFWKYTSAPPSLANLTSLNTTIRSAMSTNFGPLWNPLTKLVLVKTTDLSSRTAQWAQDTGSTVGTRTGAECSPEQCMVLNYVIANRYRGGKPRTFLPGGNQLDIQSDGYHWTSAYTTSANSAWLALASAIAGFGSITFTTQVVVHYFHGHTPNKVTNVWGPANIPAVVTSAPVVDTISAPLAKLKIGTQRRRIRKAL